MEFEFGLSPSLPLDPGRGTGGRGQLDLLELRLLSDQLFQVLDDQPVLGVFRVEGREAGRRQDPRETAAAGGRGVGLTAGACALVEEGGVDFGREG